MNDQKQNIDPQLPDAEEIKELTEVLRRMSLPTPDVDAEWNRFNRRISRRRLTLRPLAWLPYAAAIAAIIIIIVLPVNRKRNHSEVFTANNEREDIVVTASGGKAEVLDSRTADFSDRSRQAQSNDAGREMEISTPRGKDCHITLPDGTRVWLNADSRLSFHESFNGAQRTVRLTGEAYFDVVHDTRHPFVVETSRMTTTVTGTSFNVCAYDNNGKAEVALVEGSVKVSENGSAVSRRLKPGQISTVDRNGVMRVGATDTYAYTQRKDGYFYFDNKALVDIMIELGRWYNKTVVFENEAAMNQRLHFVAERTARLMQVLESMNELDGVETEMEGNEIIVK